MSADPAKSLLPVRRSLPDEVARVLREQIASGRWLECLPGEHELCAELRVSRMTLRAALRRLSRQRWVIKGGHGRRHRIAPRLNVAPAAASTEVRVLSLLVPDRIVGVMQAALGQLRQGVEAAGFTCPFSSLRLPQGRRVEAELARLVARPGVACWVLYCASEQMQRWFAERALPCFVLGAGFSGIGLPRIEFDSRAIARHAGNEFLRRGHTRIALVRPTLVLAGDEQCAAGLAEAVEGHPAQAEFTELRYEPTAEGIRAAMQRALARRHPPTAFLVAHPNFVWPVLGCLWRAGRRVPQDAVLISRADDLFLETAVPSVARYTHDGVKLGNAAARLALLVIQSANRPAATRQLMSEFVPGETLG